MPHVDLFEVIGPRMVGPSSSHTAGCCAIGLMARKLFEEQPKRVCFTLYGSFARTYKGHGSDRALVGGVMGFATDDLRIRNSLELAEQQGMKVEFIIDRETVTEHPNTVDIWMETDTRSMSMRGVSVGGGKIRVVMLNGIEVNFTGEYPTVIVVQRDAPGVLNFITGVLDKHGINIAFLKLHREAKGAIAYSVIESDEKIDESILEDLQKDPRVMRAILLQL